MQVVTCKNTDVGGKDSKGTVLKECIVKMQRRLIDAARIEFGEKGIECATTRGIAERAGCNEVTLFRHFESKKKLLAAVVQETTSEFKGLCRSPGEMTGDLRVDVRLFATVYFESLLRCQGIIRALIGEGRRQPNLAKELMGDAPDPFHQSIACYLRGQIAQGRVRPDLEEMMIAELLTATLLTGMLRHTSGLSTMTAEQWIQETVEIFVRGIEAV